MWSNTERDQAVARRRGRLPQKRMTLRGRLAACVRLLIGLCGHCHPAPHTELCPAAFFVFLAAAAGAWIVAARLFVRDSLLFLGSRSRAANEIQLGHFFVLFPVNVASEILNG